MIKVSRSRLLTYLILLAIGIVVLCINNPIMLFVYTTVLFVMIVWKGKYTFFSFFAFIMLFSYMQAVIYKLTGITSGMLQLTGEGKSMPLYFDEMSISFVSFFLTELFFVWFTRLIEYEKALYSIEFKLSRASAYMILALSVILIIAVFPSFPSFRLDATRRTQGISEVYGFLTLALCLASLTIDVSRKHKELMLGYLFIVFWVMGHGERVEVFGFVIYLSLKMLNQYDFQSIRGLIPKVRKFALLGIIGIIALAGTWIGLVRVSEIRVSPIDVIYKLLIQGTCSDVLYVFDCAIDMWEKGRLLHGYTYLDYIMQLVPAAPATYQSSVVIREHYFTMGGGLFFTEPMMNFGLIGTVLFNVEFFFSLRLLIKKTSNLFAFIWIPIVIEIFRTAWYGRSGWILAGFVEMPLLYFMLYHVAGQNASRVRK